MGRGNYLLKVRVSRKSYLFIYLMIIIIIISLSFLYLNEYPLTKSSLIISILFTIFAIKFSEIHRLKDWWAISPTGLVQSQGIFNKNIREVGFVSISDLDLEQSFFKRFLNYGHVNVRLFLNETSIKIKNINNPSGFIKDLQNVMIKAREENNATRKIF